MDFIAHEMMSKPVKGAPFSADAVTITTQTLPDGTHINRSSTTSLYRDSEGRTRREEHTMAAATGPLSSPGGPARPTVFIHDPVAGAAYVLDPQNKTARKMAFNPRHMSEPSSSAPPGVGQDATASVERGAQMRGPQHFDGTAKTESLGKQIIDGIEVEGTRHTVTLPAGAIGNDQPIQSVRERWYSPELQIVLKSVRSDPRFGQTVYQLSNIRRAEPAVALFEVPTDFAVTTGGHGSKAAQ
jgi:hypothetical protein